MIISRNERKDLVREFEADRLESNQVSPGTALVSDDLFKNRELTNWMCSNSAREDLEALFGKAAGKVSGKQGKADLRVYEFKERTILSVSERGIGTSWHLLTGNQGSRYGRHVLLSCDEECSDVWPDFCTEISSMREKLKPLTKKPTF